MATDFIDSPLHKKGKALWRETLNVKNLINDYRENLGIEVGEYFSNQKEIYIYECVKTKYRFYYPYDVDGDKKFYEKLEKFDWYYMPWKWEHEITKKNLKGGEKILEVGCGGLGFVKQLQNEGYDITGLEMNEQSVFNGKQFSLKILNETIQEHSKNNLNRYDLVCSYQVLEHISDVNSFIQAQLNCLKIGGKLVISVPNNNSFIKLTKGGLLNFPPHHMGMWNIKSLKSLISIFDIKLDKIFYEPLQKYHLNWYVESTIEKRINNYLVTRILFRKFNIKSKYISLVKRMRTKIRGHSILVIYTKIE